MGNVVDCYEPFQNDANSNFSSGAYLYYNYYVADVPPVGYILVFYILREILPLIITAASIIGNIIIILTMLMKKNRNFSTAAFFISLAVSDLSATLSGTFTDWLKSRFEIISHIDIICKLVPVLLSAPNCVSSLTLMVITLERALSVCLPHKVKLICTKTKAKTILIIIWISCITLGIFVGLHMQTRFSHGVVFCGPSSSRFEYFIIFVYPFVISSLEFFIPSSVILIGTIIIIYKLYFRPKISHGSKNSYIKTISVTLININIVFILTKLPWAIYGLRGTIVYLQGKCFSDSMLMRNFMITLFAFFNELNYVLNFYIYFLSGAKFRKDVRALMSQLLKKCHDV